MTPTHSPQRSSSAVGVVRQVAVPASARALSTLSRVDYEDAFHLDIAQAPDRTAERWARSVLQDAPMAMRNGLLAGWSAIGLKLGPPGSEGYVLGWEVRDSTPDFVLLGVGSRIGMPGEMLFKRERRALLFATFVQQDGAIARATWARVEPVHMVTVRRVLEQAGRRFASADPSVKPSCPSGVSP